VATRKAGASGNRTSTYSSVFRVPSARGSSLESARNFAGSSAGGPIRTGMPPIVARQEDADRTSIVPARPEGQAAATWRKPSRCGAVRDRAPATTCNGGTGIDALEKPKAKPSASRKTGGEPVARPARRATATRSVSAISSRGGNPQRRTRASLTAGSLSTARSRAAGSRRYSGLPGCGSRRATSCLSTRRLPTRCARPSHFQAGAAHAPHSRPATAAPYRTGRTFT